MARRNEETRDASIASGAPGANVPPDSPTLAAGEVVANRYRLIRLIARGGMGEVYEAEDLELGSRIAIKTIRAERVGDPAAIARLKQELLAARRVTHPNVVRLFDVGFHVLGDQREIALFTMELLDGETLDARIQGAGKLPVADALAVARQLASALDAGPVVFRNNELKLLSRVGISLFLKVEAELRGNSFAEIAGTGKNLGRAPAIQLISDGLTGPEVVLRGNEMIENDVGLEIIGSLDTKAIVKVDAGRADDPGKNVFYCNAAPKQAQVPGGDFAIRIPLSRDVKFELAGNAWDHAPPTTATQPENGLDIWSPFALDTAGATVHKGGCFARVTGP